MGRRVVITGVGIVSPIGNNIVETWENAKKSYCGIDFIKSYSTKDLKVKLAGEIKNLNINDFIDKKVARKYARFTQLAIIASREAMSNSGIKVDESNSARMGVMISSGIGGLDVIIQEHQKGMSKGYDRISPFFIPMAISNMAAGAVAIDSGLNGMCSCIVTACASGTNAIGDGFRQIRDGYADVMVCGGSESCISELGIGGFTSMRALNEGDDPSRASIPFDKERSGFVMGEGAGVLVLEEYEAAVSRGANIICEVVGYGSTCDAYHMTAPSEGGVWAAECMRQAINDAGIKPEDIDYINAHGTSTPMNDKTETAAVKNTFGEHAHKLAMSSTKSMTGHLLGASGAVEAILTAYMIKNSHILPTINHMVKDEDCDLDIVANIGRDKNIEYAISNSFGFGGHNASVVFKKI